MQAGAMIYEAAARGSLPPLAMTTDAQDAWTTLLSDLSPRLEAPTGRAREIFLAALAALAAERRAELVHEERPAWLDEGTLARLVAEAAATPPTPSTQRGKQYARVGREALLLVLGKNLRAWASEVLGLPIGRFASASYIEYRYDPEAIVASRLHVDVPKYQLNCLIGLRHVPPVTGPASVLRLFDRGDRPRDLPLAPGSAVIFDACRTPHSRTALGPGEEVTLLSIGLAIAPGGGEVAP